MGVREGVAAAAIVGDRMRRSVVDVVLCRPELS